MVFKKGTSRPRLVVKQMSEIKISLFIGPRNDITATFKTVCVRVAGKSLQQSRKLVELYEEFHCSYGPKNALHLVGC